MTPALHRSITPLAIFAIFAIFAILCGQSDAQNAAPDRFKQLDKNSDNVITRDESRSAESFSTADADKDGRVTVEEYSRYVASLRPVKGRTQPSSTSAQTLSPA
jgi:Ca2+-binding EF-hand superfamily protein